MSKCAKCGNTFFELQEQSPLGSVFKLNFIQCVKCGAPVGVVDYYDVHSGIDSLRNKLINIENTISNLEHKVNLLYSNQRR